MKRLKNFRDLGGFLGFDGKKVKDNMLYRSGEPTGFEEDEFQEIMDDYGIKQIVDFRGVDEAAKRPIKGIAGFLYRNFDILPRQMKEQHDIGFEAWVNKLLPGEATKYLLDDIYVEMVVDEAAQRGYRNFLDILLKPDGATLFHCNIGQDRVGWAAVIVLKILGVSDEDIMSDYLATIEAVKFDNEQRLKQLKDHGLGEEKLKEAEILIDIKAQYLETSFGVVNRMYGNFDNYLKVALNVTEDEIDKLRALYLH